MNKKEAPQAMPMPSISDQSIKEFLYIMNEAHHTDKYDQA
jgi:hypothetical protein